jgi:hypothetical protein
MHPLVSTLAVPLTGTTFELARRTAHSALEPFSAVLSSAVTQLGEGGGAVGTAGPVAASHALPTEAAGPERIDRALLTGLSERGIRLTQPLTLLLGGDGRLRVQRPHPQANEVDAWLESDSELFRELGDSLRDWVSDSAAATSLGTASWFDSSTSATNPLPIVRIDPARAAIAARVEWLASGRSVSTG